MMEVVIVDDGNRLTVYELVERVIPCIIAKHYSENYIQGFRSTFRNLLAYCNKNEKKYFTAELAQQFMLDCYGVQPGTVERRCSRVHRAMDLLSDYQHFNAVMLRRRLNREFPAGLQEGAVNYLQKLSLHGRRENTLRSHRNVLLRFTDYLFSVGVTDYKLLSADIVNRYVKVVSCNYSNSVVRLHYSILLRFFQYLAHSGYKETDLSLKMMPIVKVSASARIPTTLDLSQIESILTSVDRESPQGKRDYAVLMIAVKLGIRTSDIRNLRPANFNWEQHLVSFTQVKTGEPITLPLPTDVGWAVIDYLKNGRPVSDAPEIFLRAVAPYVSLQNFDNILIKHMRKAGIPLDSIKHHGLHSLRHSLATHMLDEGIPITSIQGVLGHINAASTQKYIGVNVRQLRSCALEVTDWCLRKNFLNPILPVCLHHICWMLWSKNVPLAINTTPVLRHSVHSMTFAMSNNCVYLPFRKNCCKSGRKRDLTKTKPRNVFGFRMCEFFVSICTAMAMMLHVHSTLRLM